ncbi:MAG: hypothetical protein ACSLFR_12210 [Solirubrobacteraceae bacterium]
MPRDAFGNEIPDDPLAGIESYSSGSMPPGVPRPRRRRGGGGGGIIAAIVGVLLVGAIGAGMYVLTRGDDDSSSSVQVDVSTTVAEETPAAPDPEPEQPAAPVEPPTGLQPGSLLRRANFIVALRRLRAEAKGRPRRVRVEAQRVDIQVVLQDGRLRAAQATWDGEVRVFSTTSPGSGLDGFTWAQINRSAPQRLVRSATGRAKKPASAFSYAVMFDIGGPRWSAFLRTGEAFTANGAGKIERSG